MDEEQLKIYFPSSYGSEKTEEENAISYQQY